MINSMTGYGIAKFQDETRVASVEVRSLNSKFLDLNLRMPKVLNEKEPELRKLISDSLTRGKVGVVIEYAPLNPTGMSYNRTLFRHQYEELRDMANEVKAPMDDIFKIALNSPDILNNQEENITESDWDLVLGLIKKALNSCNDFRKNEGATLEGKLNDYRDQIHNFLELIIELEPQRTAQLKDRLKEKMEDISNSASFDANRFEQEMIYYLEKLDIQEEIVRLRKHLDHFTEVLSESNSQGKKLGFISQEIGREINTIGSKANDAQIQKLVVGMKDELEKIKEQVLNIV